MMGYFTDFGAWGWGALVMWLMMIVFWGAIIALIVWAIRRVFPPATRLPAESATDILRRRFAAGEISEAEFQQGMERLSAAPRTLDVARPTGS